MPPTVAAYVKAAPTDHQPTLKMLRALIERALPTARAQLVNGMVVYADDGEWLAGFASRKKCPMFYMMRGELLKPFEKRLGKLRSGKSCIEFRPSKTVTLDELRDIAKTMLTALAADLD